jgi:hypothetical protein
MPKLVPIKIEDEHKSIDNKFYNATTCLATEKGKLSVIEDDPDEKEGCYEIKDNPLASENMVLKQQLEATKLQLKQAKEERCLDALSLVLKQHNCSLKALANGNFECEWMG